MHVLAVDSSGRLGQDRFYSVIDAQLTPAASGPSETSADPATPQTTAAISLSLQTMTTIWVMNSLVQSAVANATQSILDSVDRRIAAATPQAQQRRHRSLCTLAPSFQVG